MSTINTCLQRLKDHFETFDIKSLFDLVTVQEPYASVLLVELPQPRRLCFSFWLPPAFWTKRKRLYGTDCDNKFKKSFLRDELIIQS